MYKEVIKQPTTWALLGGIVASPLFVPVAVGATLIGGGLWLLSKSGDEKDEVESPTVTNGSERLKQPLLTVKDERHKPLVEPLETVNPTVESSLGHVLPKQTEAVTLTDEQTERERIRSVMSELGKRSGEARRKKKLMEVKE